MDDFNNGLLNLMIVSKINSTADTEKTEILLNVRQTNSQCESYEVNYSRQTLYARVGAMEVTEQKVLSTFVHRNDVTIDDTIESISEGSVKMLDKLAMNPVKIL
ncbi:MAG: hypothetical protein WCE93_07715 [Nitrososphaeraceae archaeon]